MKTRVIVMSLSVIALTMLSCSEEEARTHVYGEVSCDACAGTSWSLNGDLGTSGEKYYGSCEVDGDDMDFTVASRDRKNATTSKDFYFYIRGIKGPPEKGVYESGKEPYDDEDKYTTFSSGSVTNVNSWVFSPDDADPEEACYVQLYATPDTGDGELTPDESSFDYFVEIKCGGLEVEDSSNSGQDLGFVQTQLWFKNCD